MVKTYFYLSKETLERYNKLHGAINDHLPTEFRDEDFISFLLDLGEAWYNEGTEELKRV